jgi:4-hydroxybenzoate polyprenyltransferase
MKVQLLLKNIFNITRAGNLIIIALTLLLLRHTLILPFLEAYGQLSSLSNTSYLVMVIATLFIASGGYVINDFYDREIDAINKPGKNLTGTFLSGRSAILLYIGLTVTGTGLSILFGQLAGIRYPVLAFLVCAGLLFFYALSYKKMFLAGNVVIAVLTAITVFFSILFDNSAMILSPVTTVVTGYAFFAFMLTLVREIIKDCQDVEGDALYGAKTIAVVGGLKAARITAGILCIVTLGAIIAIQILQQQWEELIPFIYFIIFIQLPLIILAIRMFISREKKDDRINSMISKLIMLSGILSMAVFYYMFIKG